MKIAILGFGRVGQQMAEVLTRTGYQIVIGVRTPSAVASHYEIVDIVEAVRRADMALLALPYHACEAVLPRIRNAIVGKVLIDSTNPLNDDWSPLPLGEQTSAAETIARQVPKAQVVKAFNTIFADVMHQPQRNGQRITAFIAGDDDKAKAKVAALADGMGYAPLDTGPLYCARYLESMAHLNIHIAVNQGGGTDAAFIYAH